MVITICQLIRSLVLGNDLRTIANTTVLCLPALPTTSQVRVPAQLGLLIRRARHFFVKSLDGWPQFEG